MKAAHPVEQFPAIGGKDIDVLGSHEEPQKAHCEDLGDGQHRELQGLQQRFVPLVHQLLKQNPVHPSFLSLTATKTARFSLLT